MRNLALLALCCLAPMAHAQDAATLRRMADRISIQETMQKYVWTVDSLDADGCASVFTADAEIDSNGMVHKGREEIRKVVTDLQARQAANRAAGKPPGNLYHVISNERISFVSTTEAIYQSYWQTMRKGTDNRYVAGGFGRSEDRLVKQPNGSWLIRHRKLVVFTD